jgi:UPF0176 protein
VTFTIAAFYKFVAIEDCAELKAALRECCVQGQIKGTALIAPEGLNAMLAGRPEDIDGLIRWMKGDSRFADLAVKESFAPAPPFKRLKVKIKREIIRFGEPDANPIARTGVRVPPADWNELIANRNVAVVDTRNAYEVEAGTFEGAINPATRSFRDFPKFVASNLDPQRTPKVAMFCTGGIRCEKASAYLLSQGFAEVFQLDGGILNYLEKVDPENSLWRGKCFVFDERGALGHGLDADGDGGGSG